MPSASKKSQSHFSLLRTQLQSWYALHKRDFSWRYTHSVQEEGIGYRAQQEVQREVQREIHPDPYLVLISECMLQQTQTSRVQQLLPAFIKHFPNLETLAAAANADVIVAWQGLGYNSRALRLRDCARAVVERYDGKLPQTMQELRSLPGIGPYTAAALCAFAFAQQVVVVDVNIERIVRRVFAPLFNTSPNNKASISETQALIETLLREWQGPTLSSSEFYQSLMDLGAGICQARRALCEECPLSSHCASAHEVRIEQKVKKAEPSFRGEPNRIWRGRCVEILRHSTRHRMQRDKLLAKVLDSGMAKSSFSETAADLQLGSEGQWFDKLLEGLERDKIVRCTKNVVQLQD